VALNVNDSLRRGRTGPRRVNGESTTPRMRAKSEPKAMPSSVRSVRQRRWPSTRTERPQHYLFTVKSLQAARDYLKGAEQCGRERENGKHSKRQCVGSNTSVDLTFNNRRIVQRIRCARWQCRDELSLNTCHASRLVQLEVVLDVLKSRLRRPSRGGREEIPRGIATN
jgi:hypothetical protein